MRNLIMSVLFVLALFAVQPLQADIITTGPPIFGDSAFDGIDTVDGIADLPVVDTVTYVNFYLTVNYSIKLSLSGPSEVYVYCGCDWSISPADADQLLRDQSEFYFRYYRYLLEDTVAK